ncbi:energy transducer TonB [Beijerinckia indica]|uniref:TonB family protein n=1 Tax=Beijerinckia indica subsp. indica (strain ATCC 9039 / DSM 1715 / NCIMB 8712) TaxID=395963 RepID=B2IKW5_BEII9|nr:energy transducer TonB [Beijerinckia indica]ACB96505.1 TonB family protein [Beijerinckia indica subsp. indica ATCC 9039]
MELAATADSEQDSQNSAETLPARDVLTAQEEERLALAEAETRNAMRSRLGWEVLLAASAVIHLCLILALIALWPDVTSDPQKAHEEIPVEVVLEQKPETPLSTPTGEGTSAALAAAKQKEEQASDADAAKNATGGGEEGKDPTKSETAKADSLKSEQDKPEQSKSNLAKMEPPKQEASKPETTKAETAKSELARPATQSHAAKSQTAKSQAAKPQPKASDANKTAAATQREHARAEREEAPTQTPPRYAMAPNGGRAGGTNGAPARSMPAPQRGGQSPQGSSESVWDQALAHPGYGFDPDRFRAVAVPMPSEDGDELMSYKVIVFGLLERAKHYPETALQRGARGRAVVGFSLDDAGRVINLELLQSSGEADLDVESLALVDRASPFPVPPPGAQRTFAAEIGFGVSNDDE